MAKQRWTRESAIEYLASNPAFTPVKPLSEYKTPQLKRNASQFQDAERAGIAAPSTAKRRGHAIKVEHIKQDKAEHQYLEQYIITRPVKRDLDMKDVKELLNATSHKEQKKIWVVIRGIVKYSPEQESKQDLPEQTLTFANKWEELQEFAKQEPKATIQDFAFECSRLEWITVESIGFAYGGTSQGRL